MSLARVDENVYPIDGNVYGDSDFLVTKQLSALTLDDSEPMNNTNVYTTYTHGHYLASAPYNTHIKYVPSNLGDGTFNIENQFRQKVNLRIAYPYTTSSTTSATGKFSQQWTGFASNNAFAEFGVTSQSTTRGHTSTLKFFDTFNNNKFVFVPYFIVIELSEHSATTYTDAKIMTYQYLIDNYGADLYENGYTDTAAIIGYCLSPINDNGSAFRMVFVTECKHNDKIFLTSPINIAPISQTTDSYVSQLTTIGTGNNSIEKISNGWQLDPRYGFGLAYGWSSNYCSPLITNDTLCNMDTCNAGYSKTDFSTYFSADIDSEITDFDPLKLYVGSQFNAYVFNGVLFCCYYNANPYTFAYMACYNRDRVEREISGTAMWWTYYPSHATDRTTYPIGRNCQDPLMNCGVMYDDGTTDGTFVSGREASDLPQAWYIDIINQTKVEPVEPGTEIDPEPSPENENEESGDSIDNQYRYFGASKFITQYALTRTQLELFGEKLWTSWADTLGNPTEMWKNFKMFIGGGGDTGSVDISTALDFIISLRVFPYDLTDSLMVNVNGIRLGRGEYPIDVGTVKKMISLVQFLDFGSIEVPKPFGDYRDYENMSISLVLPYCGTTMLNPADVVGRTLTCTYAVDLQSGTCTAFVWVSATGDDGEHHYNVAEMTGQIGALLPVSATNSGQIMSQRISDAANVANLIFGGISGKAHAVSDVISSGGNEFGNGASVSPLVDPEFYTSIAKGASSVSGALSRPAISCPSLGGGSGLAAFHQPAQPYIQMRYGMYKKPNNYDHSVGLPSTKSDILSTYSGFTVCANVDVSSLTCHSDEKRAIKELLETGVYL